jgi:hypothetical protein
LGAVTYAGVPAQQFADPRSVCAALPSFAGGIMKAVVTAALVVSLAACAAAPPESTDISLEALREATERFRDVEVALAEGYVPDPMNICDTAEMMGQPASLGVMGIHYMRPDLLGITAVEPRVAGTSVHTDFRTPSVLIYEPQADGSLELVAVENLVFMDAWAAAGNTSPPTYLGEEWDAMVNDPSTDVDEAHNFEPHYDRHVWIFRDNPNGVFAQYNPNATCDFHQSAAEHSHTQ